MTGILLAQTERANEHVASSHAGVNSWTKWQTTHHPGLQWQYIYKLLFLKFLMKYFGRYLLLNNIVQEQIIAIIEHVASGGEFVD